MSTFRENGKIRTRKSTVGDHGINDADYVVITMDGKRCPYYIKWSSMLRAENCTVCEEWYSFMTFRSWMKEQDWDNCFLNKTLLGDPTHYSPDICCFLPKKISKMVDAVALRKTYKKESDYPTGVTLVKTIKSKKRYMVQCSTEGIPCTVGYFESPEEAEQAYRDFKAGFIMGESLKYDSPIKEALIGLAEDLLVSS